MTDEEAARIRSARYGALPPRVAVEDLVPTRAALTDRQVTYDSDGQAVRFACLAADLGL
ncbi:hypothetical protein ABT095_36365 [Kitasatospora sp. NPDC002227]|uniref:hypothetical protein n=1 Tax=Kitasatospora sp. NPDC002227 TaxID=3154773 RepID=UPI00331A4172